MPTPQGEMPEGSSEGGTLSDEELAAIASDVDTKISVIGCGGAGSNAISRLKETGEDSATLIATNTDAKHLRREVSADIKILLGEGTSKGRGAGSIPKVGRDAAHESLADIEKVVQDQDLVFVTAGLGGGTGTGAAPVVAESSYKNGALTIGVVTLPFTAEGERRYENALGGLNQMKRFADAVLVIPNDRILDYAPELSLEEAFKVCDSVLMNSVGGIVDLISEAGMVNMDFADLRKVMEGAGVSMIGIGEGQGNQRGSEAIHSALRSPLLDVDIDNADSALVHILGDEAFSVEQAEGIVEEVYERVDPGAEIIWGASIDPTLDETVRTMVVVTGVPSPRSPDDTDPSQIGDIDYIV